VLVFTGVVLALVLVLLAAKSRLAPGGEATVTLAGSEPPTIRAPIGETLLNALLHHDVPMPSACGGRGTCGACKLVIDDGGPLLPTERALLSRREAREHVRLACRVRITHDLTVRLPEQIRAVEKWRCTLVRAHNVATFIRELVFELPPGESIEFRAGAYVQIECPPHELRFADFEIEDEYRDDWDRLDLWKLESRVDAPTTRAYSLANHPGERGIIILNVRIALPPAGAKAVAPGVASSYLFNMKPGDELTVVGPYGDFFAKPTEAEMVFVGGGAGMAPMRSHILYLFDCLHTHRKVSFWYGARSLREAYYIDELDRVAAEHDNFEWHLALSEPLPEDAWTGATGFIHEVVYDRHLKHHPAPEDVEYYLCGPPLMLRACRDMLAELGVGEESVLYDEF
jgi:Na+-transporting NADH:ubiquinone oxidoreductase subunit F